MMLQMLQRVTQLSLQKDAYCWLVYNGKVFLSIQQRCDYQQL